MLRIQGDRSFDVFITFDFYNVKKLWRNFLQVADKVDVKACDGEFLAYVDFHVVGRKPSEIKQIILEYDGHTVVLNPGPDKFKNLSPIVLYEDGRDFWTTQLRQKALLS